MCMKTVELQSTSTPPSIPKCNHESLERLAYSMSIHSNHRSVDIKCGECGAEWKTELNPKDSRRTWTTPQYDKSGNELTFMP